MRSRPPAKLLLDERRVRAGGDLVRVRVGAEVGAEVRVRVVRVSWGQG